MWSLCVKFRHRQCSGPESVSFWSSRIRIRYSEVQIRILPSSSKNSSKNLYFYCFVSSFWLFIYDVWCNCIFKKYPSNKREKKKKCIICWRLERHWQTGSTWIRSACRTRSAENASLSPEMVENGLKTKSKNITSSRAWMTVLGAVGVPLKSWDIVCI